MLLVSCALTMLTTGVCSHRPCCVAVMLTIISSVPTCASPYLLQTVLRDFWNFTNEGHWVTSDCDAVENIYTDHYYTADGAHAAAVALNAGSESDEPHV